MKAARWLIGSAMVGAMTLATAPAHAGTSQALLQKLHDKGILSDEEYDLLLKEEEGKQAQEDKHVAAMEKAAAALDDKHLVVTTDSGIGLQVGDVTVKFSGQINGFYTHENADAPSARTTVAGGTVAVGGNSSAVRNGLLPAFLKFDFTTKQAGWDVGAHFGVYPGINSTAGGALGANNGGQPTALATSGIDFRQIYLTVGKPNVGTFKIGRDIGLFGSDAILNDITLLSVGSTGSNVAPTNTSLGRIGIGYIYTEFLPQITYTTPSFAGLQASVGIFQPFTQLGGPPEAQETPGFQAKVTYDRDIGPVKTHLWVSGLTQEHQILGGRSYTGKALDFGAKATVGPVALTGYYYTAKGVGTTAINFLNTDASGNERSSDGFYLQALATFGKVSFGGSYGESNLDYASTADATANPALVRKNSSWVGQGRYGLTSWVTLIGEYIHSKSEAHNNNRAESDTVSAGAILFF